MILEYLSSHQAVQAIFVGGCFVALIVLAAFRKIERSDLRNHQAEREKLMLIEHKRNTARE